MEIFSRHEFELLFMNEVESAVNDIACQKDIHTEVSLKEFFIY